MFYNKAISCRQVFRPVKKTFSSLWEYCPKGNPYSTEDFLGSFGVVNHTYPKKMIEFKDNSNCLALQMLPLKEGSLWEC